MPLESAFGQIALILLAAALVGAIGTWFRQPLIVSFIAVGIAVGPAGLGVVTEHEQIHLLASIGIALLLFVVGLKLDFHTIRTLGPVALATGIGQIVLTSAIGFVIALALGMQAFPAAYVTLALTFASTIIIVKLLSDSREIDALHGRIAVGVLIMQDVAVILAMIAVTALGGVRPGKQSLVAHTIIVLLKGLGFLGVVAALAVRVLPGVATYLARSPELLVLSGIAWAVALAAAGEALGLSKEVSRQVAARASAQTGIGADVLKKMLPVLASLAMAALSKQSSASGYQPGAQAGQGGIFDMIGPLLDSNRNGSIADDVLGMLGKFIGR